MHPSHIFSIRKENAESPGQVQTTEEKLHPAILSGSWTLPLSASIWSKSQSSPASKWNHIYNKAVLSVLLTNKVHLKVNSFIYLLLIWLVNICLRNCAAPLSILHPPLQLDSTVNIFIRPKFPYWDVSYIKTSPKILLTVYLRHSHLLEWWKRPLHCYGSFNSKDIHSDVHIAHCVKHNKCQVVDLYSYQ